LSEFSDFCLYNKTWWKNCTLAVSIQLYYVFIILHYAPRVYFCLLIFGYLVSAQGLVDLTQFYTGISLKSPVVTSCGTGVTACILALVFILLFITIHPEKFHESFSTMRCWTYWVENHEAQILDSCFAFSGKLLA
jgi:hypothetical protein